MKWETEIGEQGTVGARDCRGRGPFSASRSLLFVLLFLFAGIAAAQNATTVVASARTQVGVTVHYDPAYARIGYPMGDVPIERGVCADVLVRAFRAAGIDLQQRVHDDMRAHFSAYPRIWNLHGPDSNIDHRRVPNLETFFRRQGAAAPISSIAEDYHAGDVVSWRLPNGLAHIGLVSDRRATDGSARPLMIHNIGAGTQEEDVLFAWTIVGHFRWKFPIASTHL